MLDLVQHAGIRQATGAFRSSPIPSLLVDAGVLAQDPRRQSLVMRCWYKIHCLPESVTCTTVSHDARSPSYNVRARFPKPLDIESGLP